MAAWRVPHRLRCRWSVRRAGTSPPGPPQHSSSGAQGCDIGPRLRERAGRAGAGGLLRPGGLLQGRGRRGLQAPPRDGAQARPGVHVCGHGVHRAGVLQVPRVLEPVCQPEVCRRAERLGRHRKGADGGVAPVHRALRLLRDRRQPAPGSQRAGELWQGPAWLHRPEYRRPREAQALPQCRAGERPSRHGGHHGHDVPEWLYWHHGSGDVASRQRR
mmetsp:Transcript_22987/g.63834  ORF Transcript_22987/g.63834 Transcript_22987/m.63834 type:complete len:216 (-) Transcript_22987:713-1360(-)